MSNKKHHAEWLSLLEISGPFASLPVLEKVFPQGLDAHDPDHARRMRLAFDEWETKQFGRKPSPAIHNAWIQFVLKETLSLPDEVLATGQAIPQTLKATHAEAGETIRPDIVVRNPTGIPDAGKARMVVQVYPADQHLEKHVNGLRWKASPADRMAELLKQTKCQLGLVTNGEHWILTNKTEELPTGFASFYSNLWLEEPITLRAFRNLLEARRFFGALPGQTLEEMLVESATNQQEVTDQLGLQVRRAVEVLIQSLDRADQDHGRKLLGDIPETVLYEAALTVMMRLVFLFCAEERELLLLGDPLYDQHYAVSTLVAQLQETADNHGEEILERRLDAWSRLLSAFRAVYGGVQHERMKLPAYAGNLFDPDRFPFLEGRKPKTSWKDTAANPLPVNNRTVLHLLRSLQYLQAHGEAQRVSFRALGIEQIGHVYEGLLDHTAKRATEPVLGLAGGKGKEPEVALSELEERYAEGEEELTSFLADETGRSESAIENCLGVELDLEQASKLRAACGNDTKLYERVAPFAGLIHNDSFDRPMVIRKGSVYVTEGTDRRTSGTHYTPTSLTEPIVQHTLDPLCYIGPAEGKPEDEWQLRSARELLDLKVCDMACGSGAFLVQACRYLSELLVEAWETVADKAGNGESVKDLRITPYGEPSTGAADEQLIPTDTEERLVYARRLVAQRCLYGVDKNPLAVEMAKLSLWLLTLAKDKPFTFLDHCIRCGDSLVGVNTLDQLLRFSFSGDEEIRSAFKKELKQIENRLNAVRLLRKQIEDQPSNTPQDIERKSAMLKNADEQTRRLTYAADLLLAASWAPMGTAERESALNATLIEVEYKFKDVPVEQLDDEATKRLRKAGVGNRFHWPLEFPEVFDKGGFSAFVCNPPFMGGRIIGRSLGEDYHEFLSLIRNYVKGSPDLCAYFLLRSYALLREGSTFGLLATKSIAETGSRVVCLEQLVANGATIYNADSRKRWPGAASVVVAVVHVIKGTWNGHFTLDNYTVPSISSSLESGMGESRPMKLAALRGQYSQGQDTMGRGFELSEEERDQILAESPACDEVIFPYFNGHDINNMPVLAPYRWVIYFRNWPEEQARRYQPAFRRVRDLVKPYRDGLTGQIHQRCYWKFWDLRERLMRQLETQDYLLALAAATKYVSFRRVSTSHIYNKRAKLLFMNEWWQFSVLQSSLHQEWAIWLSGTLGGTTVTYSTTEALETWPMPVIPSAKGQKGQLDKIGETYHEARENVMTSLGKGLTDTYNLFHDPTERITDIQKLRDLHTTMDRAVASAYGWDDLDLCHDFHNTKHGIRFTISETARREVLKRLLKLNQDRYADELKQGLHDKTGKAKTVNTRKGRKKAIPSGPSLFGDDDDEGG